MNHHPPTKLLCQSKQNPISQYFFVYTFIKDALFVAIIFFFHYLTLDCSRDCLKALKNKCPLDMCNIFFLLCMQHSSDILNLSNLHNFNKSSYGMELEEKIIAKKSQLFQPEMGCFWFWQQNISLIAKQKIIHNSVKRIILLK